MNVTLLYVVLPKSLNFSMAGERKENAIKSLVLKIET